MINSNKCYSPGKLPLLLVIVVEFLAIFVAGNNSARPSSNLRNVLLVVADDAGLENTAYGNTIIQTPAIQWLADNGVTFANAFTAVSSCSASRSVILTGLPPHQNGMYGLHQNCHHFNSFDTVRSLPSILTKHRIRTGIIGKKHVGPPSTYKFDFEQTEENNPTNLVGRNISHMAMLVRRFLDKFQADQFFLYVAFHDPHRCGHSDPQFGEFCEKYGNGEPGMGLIPDWTPAFYDPNKIQVPYFVPDTPTTRADLASEYTAANRMDQGIALFTKELLLRGLLNNTLVIYTSDNGIPFPSGRTNLYDPGTREPFVVFPPYNLQQQAIRGYKEEDAQVSLLDIVPTILDWFGVPYPKYKIFHSNPSKVRLLGKSVMPLVVHGWSKLSKKFSGIRKTNNFVPHSLRKKRSRQRYDQIYCSHNLHEVTMYYPMRVVRNHRFKLIHNLNYRMPFPIDQDFFISPTFQELLNNTSQGLATHWYKNLTDYYYRNQWELYDIQRDPRELRNLMADVKYADVSKRLKLKLERWMNETNDPWLCSPDGVLENKGHYKLNPSCLLALNSPS